MPILNGNARNLALSAIVAAPSGIGTLSLHNVYAANADDAAITELVGGTPLYARQPVTWLPPSNGALSAAAPVLFDIPALSVVAWVGLWSTDATPSFLGMAPANGGNALFPFVVEVGVGTSPTLLCPSGDEGVFVVGTTVVYWESAGDPPGSELFGLQEGVVYYVVGTPTTEALQVSLTPDGDPQVFNNDGSGLIQQFNPITFPTQLQFELSQFVIESNGF